jgi:thiol:disulfide interchange protein DsbA
MEIRHFALRKGGDGNGSGRAQESRFTLLANTGRSRQTPGALRPRDPLRTFRMQVSMKNTVFALLLLAFASQAPAVDWVAGKHYVVLAKPQRTNVAPGKVEVLEVFSYGCPACNQFAPVVRKLKSSLPTNAQVVYLPASWHPEENWPLFQRAFLTAQQLGIADKAHDEFFDAVWKTFELGVVDPRTNKLKSPLPSINDAAQFYRRVAGVNPANFVSVSKSFGIDMKMRAADAQISAMKVESTPTLVVNGKYRIENDAAGSADGIIELVKYLVAKEAAAAHAASPAKKS